jgi:hypothetical protein
MLLDASEKPKSSKSVSSARSEKEDSMTPPRTEVFGGFNLNTNEANFV